MPIDVRAERVISLPPGQWPHTPWTGAMMPRGTSHARSALWGRTQGIRKAALTREADGGGVGVGAEVTRTAHFLGNRIDYVLRVAAHDPAARHGVRGRAMPMHVTHTFDPHPDGTLASARVRGDSSRCYRLAPPLMARKVRSSLGKDLRDFERRAGRTLTTTHLPRTIRGQ
ncbi:UNVERIFIED_CONTAM: hypothetical protein RKD50_000222 [Streptomyces canus]